MSNGAPSSPHAGRISWALALGALVVFFALLAFGAVGLNGSDQYWYAGDLRMLERAGRPVTNAVYPSALLGPFGATPEKLPPFVHNQPATYFVALVDRITDPYTAWVATNVALALATAGLVFLLGRRLLPPPFPVLSASLFLVFPFTIWLSLNALSDMSIAFGGIALAYGVYLAAKERGDRGLFAAALSAAFLYWSRESFVLLVPAFAAFAFVLWRRKTVSAWSAGIATILLVGTCAARSPILPGYPHAGIGAALMALTPSSPRGNMHAYFASGPQSVDPSAVAVRIAQQIGVSLLPNSVNELVTETLVLIVMAIVFFALRRDRETWPLRFVAATFLAIYFLTAIVFQSHNRYLYVLTPIVALLVARVLARGAPEGEEERSSLVRRLTPGVLALAVFLPLSFLTAWSYRARALEAVPMTRQLARDLRRDAPEGGIALIGTYSQQVAYAVLPRNVIALDGGYMSVEQGAPLLSQWDVRLILLQTFDGDPAQARSGHAFARALADRIGARLVRAPIPRVTTQRQPLEVWRLERRGSSRSSASPRSPLRTR